MAALRLSSSLIAFHLLLLVAPPRAAAAWVSSSSAPATLHAEQPLVRRLVSAAAAEPVYNESLAVADVCVLACLKPDPAGPGPKCEHLVPSQTLTATVPSRDLHAVVGRLSASSSCVVAFAGSDMTKSQNVQQDLSVTLVPLEGCDGGCTVHSGFLSDWKALEPIVTQHLSSLGCTSTSLIGHSLGGAIAKLHAFHMLAATTHNASSSSNSVVAADVAATRLERVYTYGEPRVGNSAFAAAFDARFAEAAVASFRLVNYMDPVPHLPASDTFLGGMLGSGWTHTSHEIYYRATALGAYTLCDDPSDKRCSAQWSYMACMVHSCDHCSYLGRNSCMCGAAFEATPKCVEPGAGDGMGGLIKSIPFPAAAVGGAIGSLPLP